MRVHLSKKELEALERGIGLLKTEYEGCDPEDHPQAPQEFWDELEKAEAKINVAKRRSKR